jgi:dihydrofolate synthase/folylpolyglutamate synthase
MTISLFFESNDISFFEMSVGMADYFAKKSGHRNYRSWNGGRLDATNIITR